MKIRQTAVVFFTIIFYSEWLTAQAVFENENLAYKYNPDSEIRFDHRVTESIDSFHIFVSLDFMIPVNPDQDYHIYYELLNRYNDKAAANVITLNVAKNCIYHSTDLYIYSINIPKLSNEQLVVLHVSKNESANIFLYDIPLKNPSILPNSDLELFFSSTNTPVISTFVHQGDSVYLKSHSHKLSRVFLFRYQIPFEAADPPMYLINKNVSKTLSYDSLFTINIGVPFSFPGPGLYYIQSDTSRIEGLSVRCEEEHFPRSAKMEDIFEPIIYLSTLEELNKLKAANDKKEAFESYWLKITKSAEKARKVIRWYYQRVEDANRFFTTYKEGWKTDMGMIYIFFGPPDVVYTNGVTEKWNYSKKEELPAISFNFIKLRNAFSSKHFILDRRYEYKTPWYRRVDMFRKGFVQ